MATIIERTGSGGSDASSAMTLVVTIIAIVAILGFAVFMIRYLPLPGRANDGGGVNVDIEGQLPAPNTNQ
jgi:uncharacterized protein involved in response to NO